MEVVLLRPLLFVLLLFLKYSLVDDVLGVVGVLLDPGYQSLRQSSGSFNLDLCKRAFVLSAFMDITVAVGTHIVGIVRIFEAGA